MYRSSGPRVRKAVERLGRNAAIVASGDMSHKLKADGPYGFAPEGAVFDAFVRECLEQSDVRKLLTVEPGLAEAAAECGLRSVVMLAGAMDGLCVHSEVYSYEGPYGVGYLCASVRGDGFCGARKCADGCNMRCAFCRFGHTGPSGF
ncbi:MAG: hypothetical protein LBH86_03270 [Oscillospiraceae bacterium]|jgi:aromatic ring-opening dioxygenase LigB subunit|nr:hypothetical protein [Oscillospiraceae bacterium]